MAKPLTTASPELKIKKTKEAVSDLKMNAFLLKNRARFFVINL
jgi:hypothetical protein